MLEDCQDAEQENAASRHQAVNLPKSAHKVCDEAKSLDLNKCRNYTADSVHLLDEHWHLVDTRELMKQRRRQRTDRARYQ